MKKNTNTNLRKLLSTTLKIGLIGFGGGSALVPVIHENVVVKKRMITSEEYDEDVMLASVTPGALPVEISACIGKRVGGWKGMIVGAFGMAFPGVILTLLLLNFMAFVNQEILLQIQFVAVGITAFITCLLTDYIKNSVNKNETIDSRWKNIIIIVLVFAVTCGKTLFRILGIERKPIVSLTNTQVFAITFVLIILLRFVNLFFRLYKKEISIKNKKIIYYANSGVQELKKEMLALAFMLIVSSMIAFIITDKSIMYLGNGFLSSIMSFGGGDAYLTVAEGLFVEAGIISEGEFYGQLIPLVNILPGSILCKTFSGIGFYLGINEIGSIWAAYLVALAGFVCSIFSSCAVMSISCFLYRNFQELSIFKIIKRWIRPIVAGLMLNVILNLVYQNLKLGSLYIFIMVVIYSINIYLYNLKKLSNSKIVCLTAILSLVFCNIGTKIF